MMLRARSRVGWLPLRAFAPAAMASLVLMLVLMLSGASSAQSPKEWSLEKFRPAIHSLGGFTVEAARVSHETTINAWMMFNYASGVLQDAAGDDAVKGYGTAELVASIGFIDHLSFGMSVPLHMLRSGTFLDGSDISSVGLGGIRLSAKGAFFKPKRIGPGLGLQLDVTLPTGGRGGYGREESVILSPRIVLDATSRKLHLMANIYAHFRIGDAFAVASVPTNVFSPNFGIGHQAGISIATAIFLGGVDFRLIFEGRFESRLNRFFEPTGTNLELTPGLQWRHADNGLSVGGGASFGLLEGEGDPNWRLFLTFGYQPGRFLPEPDAPAPKKVEPPPLADTDGDGIMDPSDGCVKKPEDMDGFEDHDGCPDLDNDKDGIPDAQDKCPNKPEDIDGDRDLDGCPDGDGDKDGIADDLDKCPTQPEDADGFEDEDGCPDPDNDKDGLVDGQDKCPIDAEDIDGWQDDDGCPDPDNDGDGISDITDKCPDKSEDIDGCQDEDGCPEEGRVCVTKDKLEISEKVFFKSGKATIRARSFPLLADIAKTMKEYPYIRLVEIQGHTDSHGAAASNLRLSDARARAVYTHLTMKLGADPSRLTAKGYGEGSPIDDNKTRLGREANRRVEFIIIKQDPR